MKLMNLLSPNLLCINKIRSFESVVTQYKNKLIKEETIKQSTIDNITKRFNEWCEDEFDHSTDYKPSLENIKNPTFKGLRSMTHKWEGMDFSTFGKEPKQTGYDLKTLIKIAHESVNVDENVHIVHERLKRTHIEARKKLLKDNKADWATAEAMAIGSLIQEGYNVRLVGEDTERGTFSNRHLKMVDQETNQKFFPLRESDYMNQTTKGRLEVFNSNLSEYGPMSYEYGYSLENPKNL